MKRAGYLGKTSVEHYILVGDLTFAIRPLLALGWRSLTTVIPKP